MCGRREQDKRKIGILSQMLGVPLLQHSIGDSRLEVPEGLGFSENHFPLRDFLPLLSVSPLDSDHVFILVSLIP